MEVLDLMKFNMKQYSLKEFREKYCRKLFRSMNYLDVYKNEHLITKIGFIEEKQLLIIIDIVFIGVLPSYKILYKNTLGFIKYPPIQLA